MRVTMSALKEAKLNSLDARNAARERRASLMGGNSKAVAPGADGVARRNSVTAIEEVAAPHRGRRTSNFDILEGAAASTLWDAAELGDVAKLMEFARDKTRYEDINTPDPYGRTAMMWAAENGHTHVVEQLLSMRADPMKRDEIGRSSIHWASKGGSEEVLSVIFNHVMGRPDGVEVWQSEVNARDSNGKTPVQLAKAAEDEYGPEAFSFLIANGADWNTQPIGIKAAATVMLAGLRLKRRASMRKNAAA